MNGTSEGFEHAEHPTIRDITITIERFRPGFYYLLIMPRIFHWKPPGPLDLRQVSALSRPFCVPMIKA